MNEERFDAAIIGTGIGTSAIAYRVAEAGFSVCVLERGKAHPLGSSPQRKRKEQEGS